MGSVSFSYEYSDNFTGSSSWEANYHEPTLSASVDAYTYGALVPKIAAGVWASGGDIASLDLEAYVDFDLYADAKFEFTTGTLSAAPDSYVDASTWGDCSATDQTARVGIELGISNPELGAIVDLEVVGFDLGDSWGPWEIADFGIDPIVLAGCWGDVDDADGSTDAASSSPTLFSVGA